jgi:hypothetical protein
MILLAARVVPVLTELAVAEVVTAGMETGTAVPAAFQTATPKPNAAKTPARQARSAR